MRKNVFDKYYNIINSSNAMTNWLFMPSLIDIELTNNCNYKCIFCRTRQMTRNRGFIELTVIKKIVDEIIQRGRCTGIRFIRWGEPTLHPDFDNACKIVTEAGIPLHVTTNGHNYYNALSTVDSVIFSMQGATEEEYECQRKEAQYHKLIDSLLRLIKERGENEKPFIQVSSTMTDRDKPEEIATFRETMERLADRVVIGRTIDYQPNRDQTTCKDLFYRLAVDWDGTVSACCADYDKLLSLGNLEEGINNLWRSETLKAYRMLHLLGKRTSLGLCRECKKGY